MKCRIWGLIGASVCMTAHADPMFISDKLVVNIYAEANQDSAKIATLDSGDALESLEKSDSYTKVKLKDGREGWVKSSYLVSQPPAIVRLRELEKERPQSGSPHSADEIKQLKEHNAALEAQVATLQASASLGASNTEGAISSGSSSPPLGKLEGEASPAPQAISMSTHIIWSVALVAVGGLVGFLAGYQTLARRLRRRYGNVRIY